MGGQLKMRGPLGIILILTLACILATTPASSLPSSRWLLTKSPVRGPFLWGAADLPSWIKRTINAHAPVEEAPTRFQRGVDPGDEGREVDMRMIFDELKRDMRAAMEEKEEEEDTRSNYQIKPYWRFSRGSPISTRTVWPEPEEKEDDYESSYHIKQPSPYSLYKYRL